MKYTYFPVIRLAISYSTMEFKGSLAEIVAEPNALLKASRTEPEKIFF
jgi:hypothetical protein